MDDNLIGAYAYSNLQRAVLTKLLVDTLGKQTNVGTELQNFYNDVESRLMKPARSLEFDVAAFEDLRWWIEQDPYS